MEKYIAVVKNEDNKVTKFQDFAAKSDADAHVVIYGGFVAEKPSERVKYWIVDADKKTLTYNEVSDNSDKVKVTARRKISELERKITSRRIRDTFNADSDTATVAKKFITDIEAEITTERAKL